MFLVAGATGSLGGSIVHALLRRGHTVRGLVRPGSDAASLEAAGMEASPGDLRDPESLAAACAGVHTVISTASATRRTDDTPDNVDARGNENLIRAARDAGVRHAILISTVGASADSPVPAFRAKAAAEAAFRNAGIDFTILQPAAFMDVWFGMLIEMPVATGMPITLVGESQRRHSFIAERDVVAFVLAATQNPAARNTTLLLGGPEAVTFRDVVAAYEAALGRTLQVRSVPPGAPIPGLPEPVWGIAAGLESFDTIIPMEATARTFGVQPTDVRAFAARSRLAAH